MQDAVERQVNGDVVFTIKSTKSTWIGLSFFVTFFTYPLLFYWLFRRPLDKEYKRTRGERGAQPLGRVGDIIGYVLVGVLVAVFLLMAAILAVAPSAEVHQMTVSGRNVRVESLYRRWMWQRRDIQNVDVIRSVAKNRRCRRVDYVAVIRLQNGDQFRTALIRAMPPGGHEDQQHGKFFSDMKRALEQP
jgi:hypothetical protein